MVVRGIRDQNRELRRDEGDWVASETQYQSGLMLEDTRSELVLDF